MITVHHIFLCLLVVVFSPTHESTTCPPRKYGTNCNIDCHCLNADECTNPLNCSTCESHYFSPPNCLYENVAHGSVMLVDVSVLLFLSTMATDEKHETCTPPFGQYMILDLMETKQIAYISINKIKTNNQFHAWNLYITDYLDLNMWNSDKTLCDGIAPIQRGGYQGPFHLTCQDPATQVGRYVVIDSGDSDVSLQICEIEVFECTDFTFSTHCNNTCHCADKDEVCHKVSGECTSGCAVGYTGSSCLTPCKANNKFGKNCAFECNCRNQADCDTVSGSCTGMCDPGFINVPGMDFCTTRCPDQSFGLLCSQTCNCFDQSEVCDKATGECQSGCAVGYFGPDCHTSCNIGGKYGTPQCIYDCHCADNTNCNSITGSCDGEMCAPGWMNAPGTDTCQTPCSDKTFGAMCTGACNCFDQTENCMKDSGACASGCAAGYRGVDCSIACEIGTFGKDCSETCRCNDISQCSTINGECSDNICLEGWRNIPGEVNNCQQAFYPCHGDGECNIDCYCKDNNECSERLQCSACKEGFFGAPNCQKRNRASNSVAEVATSATITEAAAADGNPNSCSGFFGKYMILDMGKTVQVAHISIYGIRTNYRTHNWNVYITDNIQSYEDHFCNGLQIQQEPSVFYGPFRLTCRDEENQVGRYVVVDSGYEFISLEICEIFVYECTDFSFGRYCSNTCNCADTSEICDKISGNCATGCQRGYTGANCLIPCNTLGKYGTPDCTFDCHCQHTTSCNSITGACANRLCAPGWRNTLESDTCQSDIDECNDGTHDCSQQCSNTEGSFTCSCNPGYNLGADGKFCKDVNECIDGIHECSQQCTNIEGSYTCSCSSGYSLGEDGKSCKECTDATFGTNCENKCNCANLNEVCDRVSGECLSGCSAGFMGSNCLINVPTTTTLAPLICGSTTYNSGTQICCDGVVFSNDSGNKSCCRKSSFNTLTQFCCGNYIMTLPNGGPIQGCCDGRMYVKHFFNCCNKRLINRFRFMCVNSNVVRKLRFRFP